jgi:hypothetical protein
MGVRGKFHHLHSCDLSLLGLDLCCRSGSSFARRTSEHHFWDTANKLLFASHGVLEALDFGITHHNLSDGGREMDSMAKALCESGTAWQLVFFGGRMAGVVGISYLLHRTGHHNWSGLFRFTPVAIRRMGWVTASLTGRVGGECPGRNELTSRRGKKQQVPPLHSASLRSG